MQETGVRSLGQKDPLEKGMATHSSTFAWRSPWTEEPGRLQPMGSQRVGHNSATSHLCFFLVACGYFNLKSLLEILHTHLSSGFLSPNPWLRLPRWLSGKEPACRRWKLILGQENPLEEEMATHSGWLAAHSYLGNPTDRAIWWATVHGVTKDQARLTNWTNELMRTGPRELNGRALEERRNWDFHKNSHIQDRPNTSPQIPSQISESLYYLI